MWKHGLKYGKVADLFDQLTYNFARADTARPYSDLSNKTLKHRKEFIKNVLEARKPPSAFPIDYEEPDSQLCASTFLDQNHALFQHDPANLTAQVRELRYPEKSKEIVDVLAKIMCTQEVMYHRNLSSAEARKAGSREDTITATEQGHHEDAHENGAPAVARRVVKESTKEIKDLKPEKVEKEPKDTYSQFEKEILPENIKINLEAAYPFDGRPDGTHGGFLFESGSAWPDDLKPFAFRWIHEHRAYQPNSHEGGLHLRNFITDLKRQVRLDSNLPGESEIKIYKHVSNFFFSWIKTWVDCGLLVSKGDQIQRHKLLDEALNIRRAEYIATVLDGRAENGAGMRTSASAQRLKRPADAMDEELLLDAPELLKKPKSELAKNNDLNLVDDRKSRSADGARRHQRTSGPTPAQTSQGNAASLGLLEQPGREVSVAMELSSVFDGDNVSTPKSLNNMNPLPILSGPDSASKTGRSTPTPSSADDFITSGENSRHLPFRYVPSLPPGTNPRLAESIIANKRNSLPPTKPSTPTPLPEARALSTDIRADSERLSTPVRTSGTPVVKTEEPSSQVAPSRQSATPDVKPGAPTLRLIVEQAEGSLNADNPLQESELRNSSLLEFFDKVTSRRLEPSLPIARLRLVQRWGAKSSFTIDKSTSEEEWKRVRGDIRRNFVFQSEKKPGKTKFEVYIICESEGASSEDEEEY